MFLLFLPQKMRNHLLGHPPLERLVRHLIHTVLLVISFVVVVYSFEKTTWLDAVWQAWQTTTTVGYGDGPAKEVVTKILVMIISAISIAKLGMTYNAYAEYRLYVETRRRSGLMDNPHVDGYVILQFPGEQRLLSLIREVRALTHETEVPFCVVDRHLEELPVSIALLPKVHFVRESPAKPSAYEKARLRDQRTVVVFPPPQSTDDADAATASIVIQAERYLDGMARMGKIEILYALIDSANRPMFEGSRARAILRNLDVLAIVQEAQDTCSSKVITELLSNTSGPNPVTVIPERIVGWTWGELYQHCPKAAESLGRNLTPLALIRNDDPMVSPPGATKIQRGDLITIVTADQVDWGTEWKNFETQLLAQQE